jgi:hypothetical protein
MKKNEKILVLVIVFLLASILGLNYYKNQYNGKLILLNESDEISKLININTKKSFDICMKQKNSSHSFCNCSNSLRGQFLYSLKKDSSNIGIEKEDFKKIKLFESSILDKCFPFI